MDWINRLENISNKIRLQLHAKKVDDLESLYLLMAQLDRTNSGKLDKAAFQKLLSQLGVFLTTQELRSVYDAYDYNKDEQIAYAEFVQMIRTNISEKRLSVVKHAFQFLDRRGAGSLLIEDLIQQYRAEAHPRVRAKHKTAQEVKTQFTNAILKKSSNGTSVTENEFLEYYADVNATLPKEKEEYFVDILLSTWGITSSADYVSPDRLADLEVILYEKIRQKTFTKEDEGKTVYRAFKYFDVQEKGVIDIQQFKRTLDKFGCVFSDKEVSAIFNKFDVTRSGKICYDEFCGIFAQMGSGVNPNVKPNFLLNRDVPHPVVNKLNIDLKKQGLYGFRSLSRACQKADSFQNGYLSHQEFQWVIKEVGFSLTKTEFDNLFKYFDKNHEGKVVYSHFLNVVRGDQSDVVTETLRKAYQTLTGAATSSVGLSTLLSSHNAETLRVLQQFNRKSASDLAKDFAASWGVSPTTSVVSEKSFVDFFTDLRAASDNETVFHEYITAAFRI